jgi:hypothetical protein
MSKRLSSGEKLRRLIIVMPCLSKKEMIQLSIRFSQKGLRQKGVRNMVGKLRLAEEES